VAYDEGQEGYVLSQDRDELKMAHKFISLLQLENAKLHGVVRLLGGLVDDMEANCSYEVFEAQWEGLTTYVKGLSEFFSTHQKALQSLQEACPAVWDQDEVDET
jgi:hypothetical protein